MVRKRCIGLVDNLPCCQKFIAEGQPNQNPLVLGIEELEAIRLKDMCGLDQFECASQMGLSRPTFQRLLQTARSKIALALVEGRTIMIRGGNYIEKRRSFECIKCKHTWDEGTFSENGKRGYEISCPKCGSMEKYIKGPLGLGHGTGKSEGLCKNQNQVSPSGSSIPDRAQEAVPELPAREFPASECNRTRLKF
ncbi:MAG: hypothetical protein XD84_0380 [Desulfotomaculum sp. 46_80]|nr:MAG: hypothetical protein XD84_0380 [Desulfotomaculum sp. 46_80]HAU31265.1 hypothetical protein [Desulfotomaculum sp.]